MYDDDGDDDDACFGEVGTVSWSSSMFPATEKSFDISQIYYVGVCFLIYLFVAFG